MTLAALQTRFHGAITGSGAPDDAGWDEAQRRGLAVYRNAYRMRLVETLRASFEKTWSWIGDDSFDTAAIHHLVAHPPASWTLDEAGRGFAATLAELFPGDPEVAELAALEWDMSQAFIAADAVAATAQDFARKTAAYADEHWSAMRLEFIPSLLVRPVATDCAADSRLSSRTRSCRSSAMTIPAGAPPPSAMIDSASRMAVPAVITSSTTSTRLPDSDAPTRVPPSPCALASLRLNASGRSRPRRAYSQASAVASGMPL